MRVVFVAACAIACSTSPGTGSDASVGDATTSDATDATSDVVTPQVCDGGACALTCDPSDTWLALRASSANDPNLKNLGDSDPATTTEVGDNQWHLFVGVNHEDVQPQPYVLIHEATASTPDGTYTLNATPLSIPKDGSDTWGKESPSYLRADAHTEYLYYCGIYVSYQAGAKGQLSALKRVDGGAWTKVGAVLPWAANETSQCEPDVARDPVSGHIVILYNSLETGADGGVTGYGLVARTSDNPELFDASTENKLVWNDPNVPARPTLALDPYAGVWRFSFDIGYPTATMTDHAWSHTAVPVPLELLSSVTTLHSGSHALHTPIHVDGTVSTSPQGAVLQPSSAIFPTPDEVIFFYTGWGDAQELHVAGQKCHR